MITFARLLMQGMTSRVSPSYGSDVATFQPEKGPDIAH
jgi:hypothetical protein